MDDNSICLICFRAEIEEYYSIFDPDLRTPDMTVLEKIRRCSDLKLVPEDNDTIPNKICSRCLDDLTATWRFRKNCERSNVKFGIMNVQKPEIKTLQELQKQNIKLPPNLRITRISEENVLVLNNEVEPNDKEFEPDFNDVIVETVSEEELAENVEIDEYEHFEDIYEEEEVLEESLQETISRNDDLSDTNIKDNEQIRECKDENPVQIKEEHLEGQVFFPFKRSKGIGGNRAAPSKASSKKTANLDDVNSESGDMFTITEIEEILEENSGSDMIVSSANGRKKKKPRKNATPKICDICGNSYKYQHALNAHMRRHTNEKPFPCEFCDKSFVSGVEMQRHMRVHTGHKPYSCKHCDRKFSDFGSRVKHERTHTGERPYVCPTCGKAFAYAHVLTVHLRTHTGEKKFQCQQCDKGFTKKIYLESHMLQHARCNMINQRNTYGTVELKSIKMEQCAIAEYIDGSEMEVGSCVKSEDGTELNCEEAEGDFKYIISVQ